MTDTVHPDAQKQLWELVSRALRADAGTEEQIELPGGGTATARRNPAPGVELAVQSAGVLPAIDIHLFALAAEPAAEYPADLPFLANARTVVMRSPADEGFVLMASWMDIEDPLAAAEDLVRQSISARWVEESRQSMPPPGVINIALVRRLVRRVISAMAEPARVSLMEARQEPPPDAN